MARTHLVGTSDNPRELSLLFVLALNHGFNDAGMIGSEVDETVGDAGLPGNNQSRSYGDRVN